LFQDHPGEPAPEKDIQISIFNGQWMVAFVSRCMSSRLVAAAQTRGREPNSP